MNSNQNNSLIRNKIKNEFIFQLIQYRIALMGTQ